jgi:hypothetical protein
MSDNDNIVPIPSNEKLRNWYAEPKLTYVHNQPHCFPVKKEHLDKYTEFLKE